MKEVRVAVIGCGEQARENLLPSLAQMGKVRLTALCDQERSRAESAARLFCGAKIFERAEEVLGGELPDAVVLAGPPQMHADVARRALSLGIHVFAEKPPAVTTKDLVELAHLARQQGLVTAVGHNLRHATACKMMQDLSSCHSFGKPLAMDIRYMAAGPRGPRWGLPSVLRSFLLSHAIHAVDLLLAFMGSVESISAVGIETNDGATLLSSQFRFTRGGFGTLVAGSSGPHFQLDIRMLSDASRVLQVDSLYQLTCYGWEDDEKRWGRFWRPRTLESGYRHAGYLGELESFIEAIQGEGQAQPSFDEETMVYQAIDEIEHQIIEDAMFGSVGKEGTGEQPAC